MICEKCNKNIANVYLKNNINGSITESYLCSKCSGELYGQNFVSPMNVFPGNLESDILNLLNFNKTSQPYPALKKAICPMCGSSFFDIVQSGKCGCGECYETFRNELEPNVMRIHGTAKHTGKIPKNQSGKINAKRKIEELNIKLKKMIAEQNFEQAAVIRDEINKISAGRNDSGAT